MRHQRELVSLDHVGKPATPPVVIPVSDEDGSATTNRPGQKKHFPRKKHLFHEGDPAHSIFVIESGVVLTYRLTAKGDRRIIGIHTERDVLGLMTEGEYPMSSECITPVTVRVFGRHHVHALAESQDPASLQLWSSVLSEYLRSQEHLVWLGASALARVSHFILGMAARGSRRNMLTLTMSRRDIADYLNLTIETVSRSLTSLKNGGFIKIEKVNTVRITDRAALERISSGG